MDSHRKRFLEGIAKKDKQKARRFAFVFFVICIILLLFPFMLDKAEDQKIVNRAVYVQFDKDDYKPKPKETPKAGKKSSTRPEKSQEPKKEPTPSPPKATTPEPKPEVKPAVKPLPKATKLPKKAVKLTVEQAPIKFEPMLTDISATAKVEEVSDEVLEVTEEMSADVMDDIKKYLPPAPGPVSGDDATGNKSNNSEAGEGTQGSSDTGASSSDGDGEFGSDGDGDGFDGEGLLTRKVVYRANINDLVRENGKLVVNLCVDQSGTVIWAKADARASTLKDPSALKAAEETIKKYRYAKDNTVAERQCGRYAFIVKIED